MTTVSVVVPVRDDAPLLRVCLARIAAQSAPPHEVVVVDNGSTDDTAAVARAAGARVVSEPRPGIPAAAATGYDAATGDVVVRCDADTRPPRDWLERVTAAFDTDPALDALTGGGDFYDVTGLRAALHGRLYLWSYYRSMHAAIAHPPLWGSNMAFRRSTWLEVRDLVHREDPELHDDVDLSFALGPHAVVRLDPSLRVEVSGRSLVGAAQTRRRFRRALRTLDVNWQVQPPWERWAARRSGPAHAVGRPGPARAGRPTDLP